ncbi:MAG: hypothetical protein D6E12_04915 [Desulfovibrio sp.]|nr:MAG: hypothetical protein D6E12_04915 [Desulfovibrio sp.]
MSNRLLSSSTPIRLILLLSALALSALTASPAWSQGHAGDWPGHNFLGGDYRHFPATSFAPHDECRNACMADPKCRAATLVPAFVQGLTPVCWLKDSDFNIVADSSMNSWLKPAYSTAVSNENRLGGDYHSIEFTNPQHGVTECRTYCEQDPRCTAFTLVDAGLQAAGAMCWLKETTPAASMAPGCHSGLVYERQSFTGGSSTASEVFLPNVNLPGMDYADFDVASNDYRDCYAVCAQDPGCRAYTYVRPGLQGAFGHCWLKTGVSAQVADSNTASGIIR